ncbi:MAG: ABC-type transport auxiliary lipoprotein family protein [Candidatus Latescibacterota bacterium]
MPTRNFYVLSYQTAPAVAAGSNRPFPYSLQVQRFDVQRIYNRQNIVYRFAPQELKWYEYQQWAVRPDYMVTDLILNHFENAGIFNRVGMEYLDARPDFRLEGVVEALERFDAGDVFYGHFAMSFKMVRTGDGQQVWEYSFDERKQVYQREMVYTVIALSQVFENQMNTVVGQIDSLLATMGEDFPRQERPVVTSTPAPGTAGGDSVKTNAPDPGYEIIPESRTRRK